jgi:uncharacterized protein YbbC (DUF1343 family)
MNYSFKLFQSRRIKGVTLFLLFMIAFNMLGQQVNRNVLNGDAQFSSYLSLLKGQRVGMVVNHTAVVDGVHLVDTLLSLGVGIEKIFAPEHGFRGNADAGASVADGKDKKTGVDIVSLYGKHKKPTKEMLDSLDVIVFDIQDVGVRFYTYISTMHYVMEACAENGVKFIVLDRPNPNGDYFDGPVLQKEFKSFVGMHPIPVVHGLTVGELAFMINGEGWLKDGLKCQLRVIPVLNYKHSDRIEIAIKPSPNLPTNLAVRLYPSLCFFEATDVSIGRGTEFPFQVIGYPDNTFGDFSFTPKPIKGMAMNPPQKNKTCYGIDLRNRENLNHSFTLKYLLMFRGKFANDSAMITKERWFNLLAGNATLLEDLKAGLSETEIRKHWAIKEYGRMRKRYLIYPEN